MSAAELGAAVEFLRAVCLPNGTYAYQADEVNRWVYGVTEADLVQLGRKLLRCPERPEEFHETQGYAYSSWAQETSSGEVLEDTADARHEEISAAGGNATRNRPEFVSFKVVRKDGGETPSFAVVPFDADEAPVDHPIADRSFSDYREACAAAAKAMGQPSFTKWQVVEASDVMRLDGIDEPCFMVLPLDASDTPMKHHPFAALVFTSRAGAEEAAEVYVQMESDGTRKRKVRL